MLYKNSFKVLKSIVYLCKSTSKTSSLDITVYFHNRINDLDLLSTLDYLCENGYITIGSKDDFLYSDIKDTHLGRHIKEIRIQQFKEFLLKSVCVPIAVSFITSVFCYIFIK